MTTGTSEFVVRSAAADDVPAVVALVRDVLAEFGLEFGVGSDTDVELEGLPASYADRGGAFWVAFDAEGALAGTCGLFPEEPGTFELRKMYLRPNARGRGLGKLLFGASVAWARSRGATLMVLDTVEQMGGAIAFYEANGFVRDDAPHSRSALHPRLCENAVRGPHRGSRSSTSPEARAAAKPALALSSSKESGGAGLPARSRSASCHHPTSCHASNLWPTAR